MGVRPLFTLVFGLIATRIEVRAACCVAAGLFALPFAVLLASPMRAGAREKAGETLPGSLRGETGAPARSSRPRRAKPRSDGPDEHRPERGHLAGGALRLRCEPLFRR